MKILSIILLFLSLVKINAQEEQIQGNFLDKKIAEQSLQTPFGVKPDLESYNLVRNVIKFQTYAVSIFCNGGFNFHVADYSDGTRVVTCLDGGMMGYQGVSVNGIKVAESVHVKWNKDSFIHLYPNGKITSYANKQIAELKK